MTLEEHMIDTMKEWQIKIGNFDNSVGLYYPKESLCDYLKVQKDIKNIELEKLIEEYLKAQASYLGQVKISYDKDRFCLEVGKTGCDYVEQKVATPEFMVDFLKALSTQKVENIKKVFEDYAKKNNTSYICDKESDGLGTVMYVLDENVEPYVYCVEEDVFGVTYHRFTRNEYQRL